MFETLCLSPVFSAHEKENNLNSNVTSKLKSFVLFFPQGLKQV